MRALRFIRPCIVLTSLVGCIGQPSYERNPFLTATETYGASLFGDEAEDGRGAGTAVEVEFRQAMTVTLANNHPDGELNVSFAAWVSPSSIRSAEQQDALLRGGYVQLGREVRLGTVFTLPLGTFVFNGPGTAGATAVRLEPTGPTDQGALATTREFELITPDVVLLFYEPPRSCESVAFVFTQDGYPMDDERVPGSLGVVFEGATGSGGRKTLAQVDVYQCDPFEPGLYLKLGGGARQDNEYFEGDDIQVDFSGDPDANGNCALVTITSSSRTVTEP